MKGAGIFYSVLAVAAVLALTSAIVAAAPYLALVLVIGAVYLITKSDNDDNDEQTKKDPQ